MSASADVSCVPARGAPLWITIDDVARERGVDRTNAWRWLKAQERKHAVAITRRDGRRLLVSTDVLRRIAAVPAEVRLQRLEESDRLKSEALAQQSKRIDGLSRELFEFRKASREWFVSHAKLHLSRK